MTSTISVPNLPIVRRGIDPDALADYLDDLIARSDAALSNANARIADLEAALSHATEREEAVQMTYAAATKTKQELVDAAEREIERKRAGAEEEAAQIVADSRTEALILLNNAKAEADRLVEIAGEESRALQQKTAERRRTLSQRVTKVTDTVSSLEEQLRKIAEGALDHTGALKAEIEQDLARYPDLSASDSAPPPAKASVPRTESAPPTPPPAVDQVPVEQLAPTKPRPSTEQSAPPPRRVSEQQSQSAAPAPRRDEPAARRDEPEDTIDAVLTDRDPRRGSFYSRRSARLPRIGTDNHALEIVGRMRTKTRDSALGRADEEEKEDLAIQNA